MTKGQGMKEQLNVCIWCGIQFNEALLALKERGILSGSIQDHKKRHGVSNGKPMGYL